VLTLLLLERLLALLSPLVRLLVLLLGHLPVLLLGHLVLPVLLLGHLVLVMLPRRRQVLHSTADLYVARWTTASFLRRRVQHREDVLLMSHLQKAVLVTWAQAGWVRQGKQQT
jgi:hypothetical protein